MVVHVVKDLSEQDLPLYLVLSMKGEEWWYLSEIRDGDDDNDDTQSTLSTEFKCGPEFYERRSAVHRFVRGYERHETQVGFVLRIIHL